MRSQFFIKRNAVDIVITKILLIGVAVAVISFVGASLLNSAELSDSKNSVGIIIEDQKFVIYSNFTQGGLVYMKLYNSGDFNHTNYTISCYDQDSINNTQNTISISLQHEPRSSFELKENISGYYLPGEKYQCTIDIQYTASSVPVTKGFFLAAK